MSDESPNKTTPESGPDLDAELGVESTKVLEPDPVLQAGIAKGSRQHGQFAQL